jgi:DNA-binding SARP family transcriptional activator
MAGGFHRRAPQQASTIVLVARVPGILHLRMDCTISNRIPADLIVAAAGATWVFLNYKDAVMETKVRFGSLGPVRMWDGDGELDVGSPQQRAVLALLLLSDGRQVSVDEVVEGLWGSDPPLSAVGVVRSYISRLRRVFAQAGRHVSDVQVRMSSIGGGYRLLVDPKAVDVGLFRASLTAARHAHQRGDLLECSRQLRAGLSLWRGTALAGVGGPHDDVGGSFFPARRAWLEELRATAVEERLAVDIKLGNHDEAIAELAVAVTDQPYRERLWELLMWALYRAGRQADALATYHNVSQLLKHELGLEPGPGLREIHARILAADPSLVRGLSPVRYLYPASPTTHRPGAWDDGSDLRASG